MGDGTRADMALFAAGLAHSRTAARGMIEQGRVSVNGALVEKPSQIVAPDAVFDVLPAPEYVSRGALKLRAALQAFSIDAVGRVCADIGASTGGFTQTLLEAGANRVYAIDVGVNQLSPLLRSDARVIVMENTNARYLRRESLPERVDIIVYDVSFISAAHLYPAISEILSPGGICVGLIKPQFEAGRQAIGKGGIVKNPHDHVRAIEMLLSAAGESGLSIIGLIPSPIKGGDGNIEYLAWIERAEKGSRLPVSAQRVREVVAFAFAKPK